VLTQADFSFLEEQLKLSTAEAMKLETRVSQQQESVQKNEDLEAQN